MIDFRYHIVSLISVFMALAVGIALGAGPLKETIGDTLTGQVEQLRAEKDTMRTELESTEARLVHTSSWVEAAGPGMVAGTLSGRRVAIVALGEISSERADAIDAQLTSAGATLTAHVTLTDTWTDPEMRRMRHALVGNFVQDLSPVPADDAADEMILAEALVQGLTTAAPAAPDTLSEPAAALLDLLDEGDQALITVTEPIVTAADAVVVLMPVEEVDAEAATPGPDEREVYTTAHLEVLRAAALRSEGVVLADGPRPSAALVEAVLAEESLANRISTVTSTDQVTGQISVPLALNARIGGTNGHYGFAEDETLLPVAGVLTPVDRSVQLPVNPADPGAASGEVAGANG